jgi:hypothetical protein
MRKWTFLEDKIIIEYSVIHKNNIRNGFDELSTKIDRTPAAIVNRFYNVLNKSKYSIDNFNDLFKYNKYLLDEPEVKQLLKKFDEQLKTSLYNILEYVNMSDIYLDTEEERNIAVQTFLNSDWYISVT